MVYSGRFLLDSKRPVVKILYPKPSATDSATSRQQVKQCHMTFLGEGDDDAESQAVEFQSP